MGMGLEVLGVMVAGPSPLQEGKVPLPPAYIFMIDVSFPNIQNGLLGLLSQTILAVLDGLPG